jgi:sulfur-oxidizing protein SoxY
MKTRRETLKHSALVAGLLATTGLFPQYALAAFNKGAFEAKGLADAYKALGIATPVANPGLTIQAPDIAENGAVVPVGATSTLPGVKQILILVEKNPTALIAVFNLTDSVDANIATRTKMGQSSDVYVVAVMNDGKVFFAKKEVKVTLGGCGG